MQYVRLVHASADRYESSAKIDPTESISSQLIMAACVFKATEFEHGNVASTLSGHQACQKLNKP